MWMLPHVKFPSYASAKEIWSNPLLSTNHKTADQSKFNVVISISWKKCRRSKFSSRLRTTVHWKAGRNLYVLCLKLKKNKNCSNLDLIEEKVIIKVVTK